jgi:hypothetical protein
MPTPHLSFLCKLLLGYYFKFFLLLRKGPAFAHRCFVANKAYPFEILVFKEQFKQQGPLRLLYMGTVC